MARKYWGIKEANRASIPVAKRGVGAEGDEELYASYFNQAIYETQVDYIIGTATQVTNGEANVKFDGSFKDFAGAAVSFSDGDRIAILGFDTLTTDVSFTNAGLFFLMDTGNSVDLGSTYTFTVSGANCRGQLKFTNAIANSILVTDESSLLDIETDLDGSISASGDVIENGNLVNDQQGGGKNFLFGNFEVWQRGTSFLTASSGYLADRFYATITSTLDITQETTGSPLGSGSYAKVEYQGAGAKATFLQPIESTNVDRLKGKVVTATVKVRRNANFAADLVLRIQKNATADTSTGGSWSSVASTTIAKRRHTNGDNFISLGENSSYCYCSR